MHRNKNNWAFDVEVDFASYNFHAALKNSNSTFSYLKCLFPVQ